MSDNPSRPPPRELGTFRAADGTVRRFSNYRPSANDRSAQSSSERLYTVIEQFYRELDRLSRQLFATAGIDPDTVRMASGSDRDLRLRFGRDPQLPNDTLPEPSTVTPHLSSLPPLRARARAPIINAASRSSRYRTVDRRLERLRSQLEGSHSSLEEVNRSVHETNSELRALLDFHPTMPRPPPPVAPIMYGHELAEEGRRIKRRKLDSDKIASGFKGFRYGKYGQVEPGHLIMEIVSCDGGLYSEEHSYPPENILRNDASVYCTKGNRCNIVLRHQGGTVFSLSELIIKAPGSKFSCPVREGMVFVAMESDDLFTRTAQYQIQYLPARNPRRGTIVFRHEEDGSVTRYQSRSIRAYSYGTDDDDDDDDEDEDYRTAQIPPEFSAHPTHFTITTGYSEDESDEDHADHPRPPRRRTPNRIGTLPFESDSSDESISMLARPFRQWPGNEDFTADTALLRAARMRERIRRERRASRTGRAAEQDMRAASGAGSANGMTLEEAQEASQIATQEAVRAVGGELMAPLAHFFIEKDKNKCTVRFDPPVTGRFVLLKMWSPHQDPHDAPKNIDIQAVVAKGFAGPRYSPAVELA
ncbi:hypothetical protein VTI74DRAFT_6701 [Chaetomium olivicolor]